MSEEEWQNNKIICQDKQMRICSYIQHIQNNDTFAYESMRHLMREIEDMPGIDQIFILGNTLEKPESEPKLSEEELRKEKAREFWRKRGQIPPTWSKEVIEGTY